MFKPNAKVAIIKCQSYNYQLQKLQILKEERKDRLLFNPKCLQDEDKSQRRECKDNKFVVKRYWKIWI